MTEPYSFDGDRTTLGSRAAVAVAALAAGLLGVTAGYPLATVLGVVGGLAFGVAARDVAEDDLRDRVRGSGLLLVASVLVVAALGLRKASVVDAVLVGSVPLAVAATSMGATVDPAEAASSVFAALARSFVVTVAGTLLAAALYADVFLTLLDASWQLFVFNLTHESKAAFFGFVALQVELLAVGLLASKAGRAAAELDPDRASDDVESFGVRDVPRVIWVLLAVQLLLVPIPGGEFIFEYLLAVAGIAGDLVAAVLSSVFLHGALIVAAAVLAVVPLVALVRRTIVDVVGSRPPRSLAFATGGTAFAVVVVALTSIPGVAGLVRWLVRGNDAATSVFAQYGVGPSLLVAVTGVLLVMAALVFFYGAVVSLPFVPSYANAFVFGAVALFVAAVAGAFANAPAPAVFVAMAAALVTWDFGEFATRLGEELGRAADTRTVEVVHGLGTLAAAAAAVLLATLVTHFLVPVMTGVSKANALTALGLLTVAVLVFSYLAHTAGDEDDESDDERVDDGGFYGDL